MIYDVLEKVYKLEKQGKKVVKLNVGEPDWLAEPAVIDAAMNALRAGKATYSSAAGEQELREAIAKLHECEANNVVVTPGCKFGIYATLALSLKPGDNAVAFAPYWTAYALMCKQLGATLKLVNLKLENDFAPDIAALEAAIDSRTRVVIMNTPNNPTSKAWTETQENEVIALCKSKGVLVLADDAYRDLLFKRRGDRALETGVAIATTFSKAFGMTGWRIGAIIADEALVKKIVAFNQMTITNVPVFLQFGALKALEMKNEIEEKARALSKKRAGIARRVLKGKLAFAEPDAGFYVFPKLPDDYDGDGIKFANALVDEAGVAFVPGAAFGDYARFFRLSLAGSDDALETGLKKIVEAALHPH
ncbi:MAG: aminotransferase class I/II-fold pyridoxal phosphate-dependent enzyme [Candidatus Norongarragalinales archaeon]